MFIARLFMRSEKLQTSNSWSSVMLIEPSDVATVVDTF